MVYGGGYELRGCMHSLSSSSQAVYVSCTGSVPELLCHRDMNNSGPRFAGRGQGVTAEAVAVLALPSVHSPSQRPCHRATLAMC